MVDLKEKRNIYVTCIVAPGSFHDASKESRIFSQQKQQSGKLPAILPLLAQIDWEGKAGRKFDPENFIVASAFALVFFFLHNIVKIYLFDFQEISLSSAVSFMIIVVIVIININLNQLMYHQNNGKLRTHPSFTHYSKASRPQL